MKKLLTLTILFSFFTSQFTLASVPETANNCRFMKPSFYDEMITRYDSKYSAELLTWLFMNKFLTKPVPFEAVNKIILSYDINQLCVNGTENKKTVSLGARMLLKVPAEYSENEVEQFLAIEVSGTTDPDRSTASIHNKKTMIDLTKVISKMQK